MQQSIYRELSELCPTRAAKAAVPTANQNQGRNRSLAQKWDLYGILALLASTSLYGFYALAHLV